jgi:hypothetical protein
MDSSALASIGSGPVERSKIIDPGKTEAHQPEAQAREQVATCAYASRTLSHY